MVKAGQQIGTVGNSGNARTTPPHLHFGIYARGSGPVDPAPYITKINETPRTVSADLEMLGQWARSKEPNISLRSSASRRAEQIQALDQYSPMKIQAAVYRWYRVLLPDGTAVQFSLQLSPKSVILKPSFGLTMQGPGFYEISGLAWAGTGRVARVDVSADGGASWAEAALVGAVLPKALTRFRLPWQWDGAPATLMSRVYDEAGNTQPMRDDWLARYGPRQNYHYNAIQAWGVGDTGAVSNVYV